MIRLADGSGLACRTCGQPATSYLGWYGRAPQGGCGTHPAAAPSAEAAPFGCYGGYVPAWSIQGLGHMAAGAITATGSVP